MPPILPYLKGDDWRLLPGLVPFIDLSRQDLRSKVSDALIELMVSYRKQPLRFLNRDADYLYSALEKGSLHTSWKFVTSKEVDGNLTPAVVIHTGGSSEVVIAPQEFDLLKPNYAKDHPGVTEWDDAINNLKEILQGFTMATHLMWSGSILAALVKNRSTFPIPMLPRQIRLLGFVDKEYCYCRNLAFATEDELTAFTKRHEETGVAHNTLKVHNNVQDWLVQTTIGQLADSGFSREDIYILNSGKQLNPQKSPSRKYLQLKPKLSMNEAALVISWKLHLPEEHPVYPSYLEVPDSWLTMLCKQNPELQESIGLMAEHELLQFAEGLARNYAYSD